jgi:subtilisin family serine protease
MAGAPDSSTPGLIPNAHFTAVGAFFTNAEGRPETDTRHLLDALNVLSAQKVHVINMSLVGPKDDLVHDRIQEMAADGVVFVAAAGNGGPGAEAGYPAAYEEVIAVTAVDRRQGVYDFANRGSYIDVAAPGVKIWTAQPGQREGMLSGTSLAAPFVTAVVAIAYDDAGLRKPRGGALDPKSMILAHLYGHQTKRDSTYGLGLIKAPATCGKQLWASVVNRAPPPRPPEATAQAGWGSTVTRVSLPAGGKR